MVEDQAILALIEQAKQGNQIAYSSLLNNYWKAIYNFQVSKTEDEDEAEDITIKTFAKAFDKLHTYNPAFSFETWLFTISRNINIDHFRKQNPDLISIHKHQKEVDQISDEQLSPVDKLIQEQNLAQLLAYIKQLKPHYQQVINLRFFMELSYKEIAQELNEPINNVKIKLLRAKKLLAEIIINN
ncbi:MAG: RNA polymerase subunit sigma-70 [Flavobacteriales bacterium CG_4_8_14_3_um_filter_35_10]|nr:sigma-70 family RNA polymerase sigma factor [Zetaproteobacteria bacterium]NDK18670.1 sigma-70 family RNA polymerase sigma factor [Flavobacteriales bacterium]OIO11609.1 MAG: RNA polymerase subunit sigma-70 [Flavobacteriaceae bacterium CG1_02_35_72]PIX07882.1 MAG: RNA polymerase subunit sigma-70 [Flavobacteriales bacterium CG_4_8_14_3_um_filter_35_10]PJA04700.1 MAG: RNA polymerase subunit sigma-70 [Flavobacteriales bacterium CG_4_10_14_0_2_um_filter_35_18]